MRSKESSASFAGERFELFTVGLRATVVMLVSKVFRPAFGGKRVPLRFWCAILSLKCRIQLTIFNFDRPDDPLKRGCVIECGRSRGDGHHIEESTVAQQRRQNMDPLELASRLRHTRQGGFETLPIADPNLMV